MRPPFRRLLTALLCFSAAAIQATPVVLPLKDAHGVTFRLHPGTLRLEVCTDTIIRVLATDSPTLPTNHSCVVTADWKPIPYKLTESATDYTIRTKSLTVRVTKADGTVTFLDKSNHVILSELSNTRTTQPSKANADLLTAQAAFATSPDEVLYGLGQYQDGLWNWRGLPREFRQHNTTATVPMLVSSRGYGLLWDNASITEFNPPADSPFMTEVPLTFVPPPADVTNAISTREAKFTANTSGEWFFYAKGDDNKNEISVWLDGHSLVGFTNIWTPYNLCGLATLASNQTCTLTVRGGGRGVKLYAGQRGNTTTFRSSLARAVDYTFFYGPELDDVIRGYRQATGDAPLWPQWAYGFWQCRERYSSQQELLDAAAGFRARGLPLDLIVQDWKYWGNHGWGAYEWDTNAYPDPAAMISQLHTQHVKFMLSVWCNPKGLARTDLTNHHAMVDSWIDVFNPLGRELRWNWLNNAFFSIGTDAWWGDATEPGDTGKSFEGRKTHLGPSDFFRNSYPLFAAQSIYDGQRATNPEKRVCDLTRSAFPGLQRYAAAVWSGDIPGNWYHFKKQVPAGLNFSLTGIPYWTTDCGGFFRPADQYTSPDFNELQSRWFEWCTFHPLLRMHGGATKTEMWEWLPETQRILRTYDELRYRMLPYNYSVAWRVTSEGYTFLRPLVMDFRADTNTLTIGDEYLFGPAFLVTPVTTPGARTQEVYLPRGTRWANYWTGEEFAGGQTVDTAAPIDRIPLFVSAGSIVPLGPAMQYTGEKPADPIELRIYPGANGTFTLYEDEGDSYRYEKGVHTTIPLKWDDATRTLTIGKREGQFPGMLKERTFHVVIVSPGQGTGSQPAKPIREVRYTGKSLKLKL